MRMHLGSTVGIWAVPEVCDSLAKDKNYIIFISFFAAMHSFAKKVLLKNKRFEAGIHFDSTVGDSLRR